MTTYRWDSLPWKDEEMHIDGFEVSFLVRIEDVTSRILEGITDDMSEDDRNAAIQAAQGALVNEMNTNDTNGYEYEVKSFYYGNEYYMFVYHTYRDVRLVAAPPE